jgi:hypothetical protein
MKYMMLIYRNEHDLDASTPDETQRTVAAVWDVIDEAKRRGVLVGVSPLEHISSATTIRHNGDKVLVSDGPFAETKEQLAGYYIFECKDLDEAIAWATKIPICGGDKGCIEIRPLRDLPARESLSQRQDATVNA